MEKIKKIYKKFKEFRYVGPFLIFLRNIPNWKIFAIPRLRRKDLEAAVKLSYMLWGETIDAKSLLRVFKKNKIFKSRFSFGHAGDYDIFVLYMLTKIIKPEIVVETGVASGRSSAAILQALYENQKGRLYSIDLPQYYDGDQPGFYTTNEGNSELKGFVPSGRKPGWIVPDYLRERWELVLGDAKVELPKLISQFENIDIFYHDSDHSYEHMMFEFQTVWPLINEGGFLVSDDIKWNSSFTDFSQKINKKFIHQYRSLGFVKK